jgi:hypothetical protein
MTIFIETSYYIQILIDTLCQWLGVIYFLSPVIMKIFEVKVDSVNLH